ncbi:SsgA family sporulation/cell division regulator [Kitasatospora sp. NPDC058965]|uniref:SsgA family sporulation/cell division regulator n=1 Tax=Kitasatospora sp. NPDC058965 TaxID=3346682 RepID=UPI0036A0BEB8
MSTGVWARVTMRLLAGGEQDHDVPVECSYRAADPYAVRLDFGAQCGAKGGTEGGADGGTEGSAQCGAAGGHAWVFARELLAEGLRGPAGRGDVHVTPDQQGGILIALAGRPGVALLAAPAAELARFLAATEEAVPLGAEAGLIDWDRHLDDLLSA